MTGSLRRLARAGLLRVQPGRKPDLLVLGAQKSGTSTLHFLLAQHPQILGSTPKELHYFDRWAHEGRDLAWYESHFKSLDPRIVCRFESTPSYLYRDGVAESLASYHRDLRFVVVLRDPVERAFSAWNMYFDLFKKGRGDELKRRIPLPGGGGVHLHLFEGRSSFPSFAEAVEIELGLIRDRGGSEPALLRRGLYARQIEHYQRHFPPDRFLVLGFRELTRDPIAALRRAWRHAGVPEVDPARLRLERRNAIPYESTLAPAERRFLEAFFREENERLFDLLGTRLDW